MVCWVISLLKVLWCLVFVCKETSSTLKSRVELGLMIAEWVWSLYVSSEGMNNCHFELVFIWVSASVQSEMTPLVWNDVVPFGDLDELSNSVLSINVPRYFTTTVLLDFGDSPLPSVRILYWRPPLS